MHNASNVSEDTLATWRQRLLTLLADLSWRRGPVVLASGRTSDFYLDCKQTALNGEGAHVVGQLVYAHVQKLRSQGMTIAGVGGLTLGADPIAVAATVTAAWHGDKPLHAFVIRKEPKGHGTAAWLEGARNLPAGSPVLIVEDVVTTGGSTIKAVERARLSGLNPIGILALVDRQEGGAENLKALGVPFAALLRRTDFENLPQGTAKNA